MFHRMRVWNATGKTLDNFRSSRFLDTRSFEKVSRIFLYLSRDTAGPVNLSVTTITAKTLEHC